MKFHIPLIASAVVVACMCCLSPEKKVRLIPESPIPYVSMEMDDFYLEDSISAGFFLPTKNNANYSAAMPKLQCNTEVEEIGNVNIFESGEKHRIIEEIDLCQSVMANGILDRLNLSVTQNLADVHKLVADGTCFEDILNGTEYEAEQLEKYSAGASIICYGQEMIFCSPSEFTEVISESKGIPNGNVKLLRLKNPANEFHQSFY
ncbi:MAG: hypothetical protein LBI56_01065 [Puniceicoccales bacterium]|nr:hypothetical protein [Puniceicoccales bacterium]